MVAMTKTIARAYAGEGIYAFTVCPGFTVTGMVEDYIESRGGLASLGELPIGRPATDGRGRRDGALARGRRAAVGDRLRDRRQWSELCSLASPPCSRRCSTAPAPQRSPAPARAMTAGAIRRRRPASTASTYYVGTCGISAILIAGRAGMS